ncbi:acetyltransferase [Microvirga makkahensis]|uniref:PglD N-terminal domain-containing protein n=1 Tax=Microvirga makkahensis TaxID=1128670 RepID=A0A7X3SQ57_9HYPH|nr:acetyltransferase [Microvirga makkahensis]MXQ12903.1 hypothetical protein [Microvirga makkahensis]
MKRVVCFGAGGHAKVVLDALALAFPAEEVEVAGLVAPSASTGPSLGYPHLGSDAALATIVAQRQLTHFIVGIGSVRGGGTLRPKLFELALDAGLTPLTVIHPSATVARSASIGLGSVILAGAVVQPGVQLDSNVIVNTRASIDHDSRVGKHTHIAPGVTCSGNVSIGENSHIGTAATIIEGIAIGHAATIGAGAVVVRNCPDNATVYGVPAREKDA